MPTNNVIAARLVDVLPRVMHRIRSEMRSHMGSSLTVPQFRILSNVSRGMSRASDIAVRHGVRPPTMSRMVDGLVKKGLIRRRDSDVDRRQIELVLTAKGELLLKKFRTKAEIVLADELRALDQKQLNVINQSLSLLDSIFGGEVHG